MSTSGHDYDYGIPAEEPTSAPAAGDAAAPVPPPAGQPAPPPVPPSAPPPPSPRHTGRTILWAALAAAAVLAIVVAAGALFLLRPWEPGGPPTATTPAAPSAPGGSATAPALPPTDIDGVSIAPVSVVTGITSVGRGDLELHPEGEFVAVELEITNGSDQPVFWNGDMELADSAGAVHAPSPEASMRFDSDAVASATIPPGETATVVLVYDVPIGTTPAEGRIALSPGSGGGTGSVSLTS